MESSSHRTDSTPGIYESAEEVWRRAGVPRTAIERLAEADAFHCLAENRRQSLWKVKGLSEAPLPLFAAADAREAGFSPEGIEPAVALRPMSAGREVVAHESPHSNDPESAFEELVLADKLFELQDERP